jgi:TonB family protein
MNRNILVIIQSLMLGYLIGATTSGIITTNEIWRNTITLTGDVEVAANARLTISPNTVIRVLPNQDDRNAGIAKDKIEIIVKGELICEGVPDNDGRIRFTSAAKTPIAGDWHGIVIMNQKSTTSIKYATIEYAFNGVTIVKSKPKIYYNLIQFNYNAGIVCKVYAEPRIQGSLIMANAWAGVLSEQRSKPVLQDNIITNNDIGILLLKGGNANLGDITGASGRKNPGNNKITANFQAALDNHTNNTIYAQSNLWASEDFAAYDNPDEIIIDDDEKADKGAVVFLPLWQDDGGSQTALPIAQADDAPDQVADTIAEGKPDAVLAETPPVLAAVQRDPVRPVEEKKDETPEAQTPAGQMARFEPPKPLPEPFVVDDVAIVEEKEVTIPEKKEFQAPTTPVIEMVTDQKSKQYSDGKTPPVYPGRARSMGISGDVYVQVFIDEHGKVYKALVVKTASEMLNDAALEAARQTEYRPMTMKEQPVKVQFIEKYRFVIN